MEFRGNAYELLKSYLSNRQQHTKTNYKYSDFRQINTGVLKGRILGSLLFLVYINDLLT